KEARYPAAPRPDQWVSYQSRRSAFDASIRVEQCQQTLQIASYDFDRAAGLWGECHRVGWQRRGGGGRGSGRFGEQGRLVGSSGGGTGWGVGGGAGSLHVFRGLLLLTGFGQLFLGKVRSDVVLL